MKRSEFDMDHGAYGWNKSKKVIPVSEFRKMKVKPEKSLQKLKQDLDKVFNEFIRLRDTVDGKYFKCISCGELKPLNQMHAGHYFSAGHHSALRWVEQNVNGQCVKCNTFLSGNLLGYYKGMIAKWGHDAVFALDIAKNNRSKMFKFEVQLLIEEYKAKLKTLKNKKV